MLVVYFIAQILAWFTFGSLCSLTAMMVLQTQWVPAVVLFITTVVAFLMARFITRVADQKAYDATVDITTKILVEEWQKILEKQRRERLAAERKQ